MIPPLDWIQHVQDCKRKRNERAAKIAALPKSYLSPLSPAERGILDENIEHLVNDVHSHGEKKAIDILRAYGKAAVKAQEETNCLTEILMPEAERWIAGGDINLKGPLAGIPVSLKDSINVAGFDSTVGYSRNVGKPIATDGPTVRMLKDAGAVPFVKTALPVTLLSFESFNDVWGRALNPHNPKYSPGGSTGGEGALLAFGGSRIGVGSDVAGSEGIPSVFSPMARTLTDLIYFTRSFIQMQPWKYDHTVHPLAWRTAMEKEYRDKTQLKVGILRTDTVVDPSPACARALDLAASALRDQGHQVFDVTPPNPYEALVIASNLLNADGTVTFRSFFRTGESDDAGARQFGRYMRLPRFIKWFYWVYVRYIKRDAIWAGLIEHWHAKSAAENWQWVAKRELYKQRWHEWWNGFGDKGDGLDIILTPPNSTPAVPHGGMASAAPACGYTFLFNLLDYTCGILPVTHVDPVKDALPPTVNISKMNGIAQGAYKHYDAVKMAGLPVAVQVVGRRLEEEKVLACMQKLEDALDAKGQRYELLQVPDF